MGARKNVLVSGAFSGQMVVEIAAVAGGTFCPLRTFTAPRSESFEVACAEMRVSSQNVGGAPVVDVTAEQGIALGVNLDVPAGDGSGLASDITAFGELMTAIVQPFGAGVCFVELSEDGVNWVQAFPTFTTRGGWYTRKNPGNFARVTRASVGLGPGPAPVVQLAALVGGIPTVQYEFVDTSAGAQLVVLPPAPTLEDVIVVKDTAGLAEIAPITVDGNGNTIDGDPTFVIAVGYGSITLVFNGTEWSVI